MPASDYKFWLGKETADLKWVGKRGIHRRDADDKATGKGKYGRDIKLPGMLYARIMMCPHAHAKIKSLDTSAAEALPGVRAVLRYDDPMVPQRLFNPWEPDVYSIISATEMSQPVYVLGPEAFFEGAPVGVAIAADDLDIADEAMDLVKVEWEVLPFVIEIEKALEPNAPRVYEHLTEYNPDYLHLRPSGSSPETVTYSGAWEGVENATNIKETINFELVGTDLSKGFAEADDIIEFSFNRTEQVGTSPEILASVVEWTDNDTLEIWQGGENPINLNVYSMLLGMPKSKMNCHSPYAGGQFGGWDAGFYPPNCQVPVGALLSKKTNCPIKVMFQRKDENFAEMDEGVFDVKVGFKNDGTITAVEIHSKVMQMVDIGFNPETAGGGHLVESTKIPNIGGDSIVAFAHKHGFGPYRCEQQINAHIKHNIFSRVAAALGVDEGVIGTVNNGQSGRDMDWVSEFKKENGIPDIDSLGVVLPKAKEMIGFEGKFHAPGAKMLSNGKYHGITIAPNQEFQNGNFYPYGYVVLSVHDGNVCLTAERPDCGVDSRTGYCRTIAEETGMDLDRVLYKRPQEESKNQLGAWLDGGGGSVIFTMQLWTVVLAARTLKKKMLAAAAATLGVAAEDLDIVDNNVVFKNDPSNATPVEAIRSLEGLVATSKEEGFASLDLPTSGPSERLFVGRSVNIVEVEVDPETGGVDVINAVCVNDVGMPISPETVEGQNYGCALMGYSTGATEEVIYDPGTGVRLNPNFLDYKIFTILDAPKIKFETVASRMGYSPYGAAGCGEDNCTFGSPMIIPAIYNAIGVWVDTYPPTPERVLKALGKA